VILTDEERRRFVDYLEDDATSTDGIVQQMESIHTPAFIVQKFKAEAIAMRMVAAKLRTTETVRL